MRIIYTNTVEDFVAFNVYHANHSPTIRRLRWAVLAIVVTVLAVAVVAAAVAFDFPELYIGGACAIGFLLYRGPNAMSKSIEPSVRRMCSEGKLRDLLGLHELTLEGDDLVEKNPVGESRQRVSTVDRIVVTDGYTFIYANALSGHIIPHHAVSEGDPAAFAAAVEHRRAGQASDPS